MSTTISALLVADGYGVTAQVGDSRIYRVRGGVGAQLTEDHTLVNYKLKQGLISESRARTMKGKNVITRAVGHKDYVEVDTREIDVQRRRSLPARAPTGCTAICKTASSSSVLVDGEPEAGAARASSSSPTSAAARTTSPSCSSFVD